MVLIFEYYGFFSWKVKEIFGFLGSSGSLQSWASSLSADSQSEEAAAEFMKFFVTLLFDAPGSIDQEQKATFGQMVQVS